MSELRHDTTDEQLWEAIRKGEETAFRQLYERYWSIVFTTAYAYLQDSQACGEIVQDIFLSIWLRKDLLEMHSFYHYLKGAARYQVYKRLQQRGSRKIIYMGSLLEPAGVSATNEGDNQLRYHELQDSVDGHLKSLPKRCQEIFHLSRKEQLSIEEIAQRLNISRRTVENQLTRALQHLRHSLGDMFMIWFILGYMTISSLPV